ncbi:hypothetical protein [Oceanisphaera arctica]|uniref:DUF4157 domain-containing protein n=1 Tax=Oceanisphaera arctica TaxID=641510 RepID=A0A2P5TMG1_9GAMM|nr:hypothetical protein [Oceanisphaera arctica]PPL16592.1 hypothetical protein UN63_08545 [Oceanisphaera arctica]GHA10880.1 hypothetical protein GCM10007082_09860 [Oceanisphaera arctica]
MPFDILAWVTATNHHYREQRRSCTQLAQHFGGFFGDELLSHAGFVVVEQLPRPPDMVVRHLGLGELLSPGAMGLTLDDTYYLKPRAASQLRVHFHELVHVLQWRKLGADAFIQRYLNEILQHGYRQAPLEQKAYRYEQHYAKAPGSPFIIEGQDTV